MNRAAFIRIGSALALVAVALEAGDVRAQSSTSQVAAALTSGTWDGSAQGNARLAFRVSNGAFVGVTDSNVQTSVVLQLYSDGVLRGWWTELPTRTAPHAGECEFRLVGDRLDGRYRAGSSGPWIETWDLDHVTTPPGAIASFSTTRGSSPP